MTAAEGISLDVTGSPAAADLAALGAALTQFNDADVGPAERQPLAVLIREEGTPTSGGLSGFTAWGWLYVQWLFVPEALRGQGVAGRLLAAAEAEAETRGCIGSWIDTFSPLALGVYRRNGYVVFGELPDFPPGRSRWFLRKSLRQN